MTTSLQNIGCVTNHSNVKKKELILADNLDHDGNVIDRRFTVTESNGR